MSIPEGYHVMQPSRTVQRNVSGYRGNDVHGGEQDFRQENEAHHIRSVSSVPVARNQHAAPTLSRNRPQSPFTGDTVPPMRVVNTTVKRFDDMQSVASTLGRDDSMSEATSATSATTGTSRTQTTNKSKKRKKESNKKTNVPYVDW